MSDDTVAIKQEMVAQTDFFPVLRYAVGSAIVMLVAMAADYTLAYLTPVLALTFLAPGSKSPTLKGSAVFILIIGIASLAGMVFSRLFLEFPLVFIPLLTLILFHLFYTTSLQSIKMWLIISLLVIPMLSMESYNLGNTVAINLFVNALVTILMVWLVYFIFPAPGSIVTPQKTKAAELPSPQQRFISALERTLVVFPVLVLFFVFNWSGSLLVLVFIALLSLNPASANKKTGIVMIVANISGGLAAILVYNLLIIVPDLLFLGLLTVLAGLFFGNKLFSKKPLSPMFGMAFSTFVLVLGSVTSIAGEAGEKVWLRVLQIGIAVIYIVVAFGLIDKITRFVNEKSITSNKDQNEV